MRILLVAHGFPPAAVGGTEIYTRALGQALAALGMKIFVLTREANPCRPDYSVRHGLAGDLAVTWINNTFGACTSFADSYTNATLLQRAETELERIAPDVVHVQHLTCLSTGIPAAAARRGIPVVMTLNDYWLICHRGQLLTPDGRRCDGPFDDGCQTCLPASAGLGPGPVRAARWIESLRFPGTDALVGRAAHLLEMARPASRTWTNSVARLQHMREAVRDVDVFLAPSRTAFEIFSRFGIPPDRLRRCAQGISLPAPRRAPRPRSSELVKQSCSPGVSGLPITGNPEGLRYTTRDFFTRSSVLRVGFAGTLIPSKAPHVLLEAVATLPTGAVEVHLLGEVVPYHGDSGYRDRLEPLLTRSFVRRFGLVPHEAMAAALAELDILVVPSIWIENAPFVIREAFAVRTPVIASNLGGMAEMVRDGVDGLLFRAGDAEALAAQLKRLLGEPGLLEHLRGGIRPPLSIEEDAELLLQLYRELIPPRRAPQTSAGSRTAGDWASDVCAIVLNHRTPDQTLLAVTSLQTGRCRPGSVIVIDNGSDDGSAHFLRERLNGVTVLETASNLGFSAGCNVGISRALAAGARFVLLVNSDVVLHPDAVGQLQEIAAANPEAGVLAPILLSREEPDRVASAGIAFAPATGRMVHRSSGWSLRQLVARGVNDVDAVSGCVMLVRAEVFEAVGFLDDAYFFSFEDVDLCLRARAAGFRVVCVDDAVAYHLGGFTIGSRSPRRVYFATRNHLRVAARRSPAPRGLGAARAALIVGFNLAYALTSPDVPVLPGIAGVARGTWHHLIGRYGAA